MKDNIKGIVLGLLFITMYHQGFSQTNRCGYIGLVDLSYSQLFVNITKGSSVADNEYSYPTLFTIELPNKINDYWYNLARNSEYVCSFEKNQLLFIFDNAKNDNDYNDFLPSKHEDRMLYEVSRDSADFIIHTIQSFFLEQSDIMNQFKTKSDFNDSGRHFYVATCNNVFFVFYNIADMDIHKIITSFIVIRPHIFQVRELSD